MGKEIQSSWRWLVFLLLAVFPTIAKAQSIDIYERAYWWNVDETYSTSISASESLIASYNMIWPYNVGDPNAVLMTDGTGTLRWALVDPNIIIVDPCDPNGPIIALPKKTPWNVIFVGANGFPIYDDPNHFTYYQPNGYFGVGTDYITGQTYANNYIQVYTLLDFEPDLHNVTIGLGQDDTTAGPNNTRLGHNAGPALDTGNENTLGGKDAGQYLVDANDNTGIGYKVIGGAGDGNVSGDYTEFFFGMAGYAGHLYLVGKANTDSTLDTTWGDSGYFEYIDSDTGSSPTICYDIHQLSDGRLLVATNTFWIEATSAVNAETGKLITAVMLEADGTIDTDWGYNGFLPVTWGTTYNYGSVSYHIFECSDGTFIFAGQIYIYKVSATGTITATRRYVDSPVFGQEINDGCWYDDDKTRLILIGSPTTDGYRFNTFAIDPDTLADDTTWCDTGLMCTQWSQGMVSSPGHAFVGHPADALYYNSLVIAKRIIKISDGFVILHGPGTAVDGGYTVSKIDLDGNSYDSSFGTAGMIQAGYHPFGVNNNSLGNSLSLDSSGNIWCMTEKQTGAATNDQTISIVQKFNPDDGSVLASKEFNSANNDVYNVFYVINDDLYFGTRDLDPAYDDIERWDSDFNYVSSFDVGNVTNITIFFPDETTRYPTSLDVHRVTAVGAYAAGRVQAGADDGLYLGTYSGAYNTTDPNRFFLDNLDRGDYAGNQGHGMMYGYFAEDPNDQWLTFNIKEFNLPFARLDVNDVNIANDLTVNHIEALTDVNSSKYYVGDSGTYITKDGSDNLTLTDAVTGTKTLAQLGSPTYIYIKAETQAEGDLDLSDVTNWGYSKAYITQIRVVTSSTDWDLYILQNDNGYAADDAVVPKLCRVTECSGDATLMMNLSYEDEDDSKEVHLYYNDDSGANTADIYIVGYGLI